MSDLQPLFAPRRLAVLGASRNPAKLGHGLLKNVLAGGFPGEVLVVNPAGEPILGAPTVRAITDLPPGIDLALVSLPPAAVLEAITALAARGVRAAVILTSGFGEVDARGQQEQAALLAAARPAGLRLVGPNCIGVASRPARLNGTYLWSLPDAPGGIAVVSQSGAYGGLILKHLGGQGLGVSRFLSIGNQVDVEIAEALDYFREDPETRLVAGFVEGLRDGRRFVEAARRLTAGKPLVLLKGGRSEAGRRAAGSHTGSLAGEAEVYQAAFARAGAVVAGETEEFFDAIQALATAPRRPARPSLAIVTVSGGPAVAAADAAQAAGLEVPATSEATRAALGRILPPFAALGNPVDLTPQVEPGRVAEAARILLSEPAVAGAVAVDVGLDMVEFARGIAAAAEETGTALVACAVDVPAVTAAFREAGVPVYPLPERAVKAWRALWRARDRSPDPPPPPGPPPALRRDFADLLAGGTGPVPYETARTILAAYGIRFCRDRHCHSPDAAVAAAETIGYPVVVKSARPDLLHRSEAGAVVTDLRSIAQVRAACRRITDRAGAGPFLVQEQVVGGVELLLGGRQDPVFGPLVAVGTGGFLAEAVRDVSTALAPLGPEEARALVLGGLRGRLLGGYRGLPPGDPDAAGRALMALGRFLSDHPRVAEVDLNPVIVRGEEALAVDALLILGGG